MKQILLMIAVVALVMGCALTRQIVPLPTGEISAPNNGMSRIILYSEPSFPAYRPRIFLNGKVIGELAPKSFLYWDTEPGFKTLGVRFDEGGCQLHRQGGSNSILRVMT